MKELLAILFFIWWMAGVVIAKGWMCVLSIFVPFYSWYLVIELIMRKMGVA